MSYFSTVYTYHIPLKWYNRLSRDTAFPTNCMCVQWRLSSACALWVIKGPKRLQADSGLWSDYVNAQPGLSPRWAHMQSCKACCRSALLFLNDEYKKVENNYELYFTCHFRGNLKHFCTNLYATVYKKSPGQTRHLSVPDNPCPILSLISPASSYKASVCPW